MMFLINKRVFSKSRGFNLKEIMQVLISQDKKQPLRRKLESILKKSTIEKIELDLPPCKSCDAQRLSSKQKFCHNCGTELITESRFEKCIKINIGSLPLLTVWKRNKILDETNIKTIGDLVFSESPASELRKARGIGEIRARQIHDNVVKYVDEFLS